MLSSFQARDVRMGAKGAAADGSAGGEAEIPQRQDLPAVECKRQGRVEADLCLIKVPKRQVICD